MTFLLTLWLWCLFGAAPFQAPSQALPAPAPLPRGLVVGQVVDATTNRPVSGATVTIGAPASRRVITDDAGRFLFRDLAKASYLFTATAPGYLDGGYGQRRIGGAVQPFVLAEDQKVGDVVIRLWKEASVSGVVTDETGSPVVGVYVSLVRRDPAAGTATGFQFVSVNRAATDDRGAYRFAGLAPGDYLVSVVTRLTAMPVDPQPEPPAGSNMIGTVLSPMISQAAPVLRLGDFLVQTTNEGMLSGTNQLFTRLPASSAAAGRPIVAYPPTFYPGVASAPQAGAIALLSGVDRSGINLQLKPVAMARVSGTLIGPEGPLGRFGVHLMPAYAANTPLERTDETASTATDAGGAFTFIAVPPGQYILKAWRLPQVLLSARDLPLEAALWGEMPVTVGADAISGMVLRLQPGATLSGRVVFDGATPPTNIQILQQGLGTAFEPAGPAALGGSRLPVRLTAAGEFSTMGVPPGAYSPKLPNPLTTFRGWYFESVKLDSRDLIVSPLVVEAQSVTGITITYTDRRTQLSGTIHDAAGKPDAAASVLVIPADYRAWIQGGMPAGAAQIVAASQTGEYALDLRAGEYLVAAVGDTTAAEWQQPATIQAIAAMATRITVARGDSARHDLKIVRR